VALLEINAVAGKATRTLAPLARRVLHAWRLEAGDGERHRFTGPPLGVSFRRTAGSGAGAQAEARRVEGFDPGAPLVLVLGGSQGARAINRFVAQQVDVLARRGVGVLHQVGPGRLEEAAFERSGYRAVEYVADVPRALRAATLVLCRGGASTLAEVAALRRPAVVVPYPHHPDRHQERNARQLGAGVRIVDETQLGADAARELARLAGDEGARERARMVAALEGALPGDGALRVWRELRSLTRADSVPRA
jgi:UDP-N-acetylglucosamine--N-acetylmuramyl-(pentapeptide) pyrophosphoryl-undecaprenol N-acetylglucosamine transferase